MKKLILILLIFLNFNFTFTKDIKVPKIDPNPENIINDDYFHCPYEEENNGYTCTFRKFKVNGENLTDIELKDIIRQKRTEFLNNRFKNLNIKIDPWYPCDSDSSEKFIKCYFKGFAVNKDTLNESELKYIKHNLKDFFKILRLKNIITMEIIGHTDSEEKDKDRLSLKRAENFYKFLRENGLDESTILDKISGKGDKEPADTNKTVQGRYNNRRIQVIFKSIFFDNK